jgi:hypothetical protein
MKMLLLAAGLTGTMAFAPATLEPHPHIRSAVVELEAARQELKTAAHDFGGHRVAAMKAIDGAIRQLKLAQHTTVAATNQRQASQPAAGFTFLGLAVATNSWTGCTSVSVVFSSPRRVEFRLVRLTAVNVRAAGRQSVSFDPSVPPRIGLVNGEGPRDAPPRAVFRQLRRFFSTSFMFL